MDKYRLSIDRLQTIPSCTLSKPTGQSLDYQICYPFFLDGNKRHGCGNLVGVERECRVVLCDASYDLKTL